MLAVGPNFKALYPSEERDGAADTVIVGRGVVIMAKENAAGS